MDKKVMRQEDSAKTENPPEEDEPMILEEIDIEELYVDGICGVY